SWRGSWATTCKTSSPGCGARRWRLTWSLALSSTHQTFADTWGDCRSLTDTQLTAYDWQQADIDHMIATIKEDTGALVVSAPGAGKTLVAIEALRHFAPEVTLIIAPPSTHLSAWARTLKRQGV